MSTKYSDSGRRVRRQHRERPVVRDAAPRSCARRTWHQGACALNDGRTPVCLYSDRCPSPTTTHTHTQSASAAAAEAGSSTDLVVVVVINKPRLEHDEDRSTPFRFTRPADRTRRRQHRAHFRLQVPGRILPVRLSTTSPRIKKRHI